MKAMLTDQGTAASETGLCARHDSAQEREFAEDSCTSDDVVLGSWTDVTGNRQVDCRVCGIAGDGSHPALLTALEVARTYLANAEAWLQEYDYEAEHGGAEYPDITDACRYLDETITSVIHAKRELEA